MRRGARLIACLLCLALLAACGAEEAGGPAEARGRYAGEIEALEGALGGAGSLEAAPFEGRLTEELGARLFNRGPASSYFPWRGRTLEYVMFGVWGKRDGEARLERAGKMVLYSGDGTAFGCADIAYVGPVAGAVLHEVRTGPVDWARESEGMEPIYRGSIAVPNPEERGSAKDEELRAVKAAAIEVRDYAMMYEPDGVYTLTAGCYEEFTKFGEIYRTFVKVTCLLEGENGTVKSFEVELDQLNDGRYYPRLRGNPIEYEARANALAASMTGGYPDEAMFEREYLSLFKTYEAYHRARMMEGAVWQETFTVEPQEEWWEEEEEWEYEEEPDEDETPEAPEPMTEE